MDFSLARFRHFHPSPPFWLGGIFARIDGRHFLHDAHQYHAVFGSNDQLKDCATGDQVRVHVIAFEATSEPSFRVDQTEVLTRSTRGATAARAPHAPGFAAFTQTVRAFFTERGLSEVFTPTLVTCPGLEPSLEPFALEITRGREVRRVYLPTSPEISLKKALARGYTDIFELKPCFRRGEFSAHHESEFLMLEWYRSFADLNLIQTDLEDLLTTVGAATKPTVTTFKALFHEDLDFRLTPATSATELRALARSQGVDHTAHDSFNDLFHRLMVDRLEPNFANEGPLIVRDFPPSLAALAKLTPEGWADRFEFYWNGLEIANAFNEVTDPREQASRWQAEMAERHHLGTTELAPDQALIRALERGLPPTGGIALGLERLYMARYGVKDISELRLLSSHDLFTERE